MHAPTETVTEPDGAQLELTDIPIRPAAMPLRHNKVVRLEHIRDASIEERGTLLSLLYDVLVENWRQARFGPCIQGAVFELELDGPPRLFSLLDGYLTVSLGDGPAHFHLCIGSHQGLQTETSSELARHRQCARAAFYRRFSADGCVPGSWGILLWNGAEEQMITLYLPSPFLDDRLKPMREPDWSRLALWNQLRARYLGETEPQPIPEVV
ncbi:MAG: hypothetical protein MJE77_28480 [Proteobacteria bacterium]|nr:hypothetical protein [Pseudomonadota bacterium]